MTSEKNKCFIICPIGGDDSSERKRSDLIYKHIFTPALNLTGYEPIRADKILDVGLITSQIINLIIDSPLVIADLTGGNPNVFYELAIRHVTRKPYIQIIEKGERLPFDTHGVRTIMVDHKDMDSVEECQSTIVKYIEHFHKGNKPESPISVASNVRLLQSDPKHAESLLEKLEEIQGYGFTSIDDLGDKLDDLDGKLDDVLKKLDEEPT